ncbi:MAG TPA: 4Fe-4S dicluster domain-containing protein [Steroidobacteraceae bacterium]|nr:4Fe-4S dicluster domain-containing protein [Steroidobacteraceae bacterium]
MAIGDRKVIEPGQLQQLLDALWARGYRVLGPTLRDGAIVYDEMSRLEQLPRGWTDRQEAGHYRLERRADGALFGYAVGPQSWKRCLHPPVQALWRLRRADYGAAAPPASTAAPAEAATTAATTAPTTAPTPAGASTAQAEETPRFAFLGVRACELAAIAIQDRVLLGGAYRDGHYERRRRDNILIALNCSEAGGTCFCVSMQTGPAVRSGFDLALTELLRERHELLVEVGSERGDELIAGLQGRAAEEADLAAAAQVVARTAAHMGRSLQTGGLKELLQANLEHPRWDEVAERCLSCANCTLVCPTCFCTSVEDHTDLAGETAVRERRWDSCFTLDFSYLHGGSVRRQTRSRYRQWMTHKLANWFDQFGTSGCVGCGRCITWCPVGIDITAEAAAIRDSGAAHGGP